MFLGGSAKMLYNALCYFPVLMVIGGAATICWNHRWGQHALRAAKFSLFGPRDATNVGSEEQQVCDQVELQEDSQPQDGSTTFLRRASRKEPLPGASTENAADPVIEEDAEPIVLANLEFYMFSWKFGVAVIACFLVSFVIIMVLRGTLHSPPLEFSVFSNLYLAGTIIFGGGPVVIPLLREYVVAEGWVSSRDFLPSLAICQVFPCPNFNLAVYLGALAVSGNLNPAAGTVIGYLAIFAPGVILHTGTIRLWKALRNRQWFISGLRGVNAAAVGLIYTAVYRLWEQGILSETVTSGSSLGLDPWWIVVTATSFVGGQWFNISAPVAVIVGGIMGMVWYGVVVA